MDNFNKKINLINLLGHYKLLGDIQAERGNFEEAKAYDDLARAIDLQILDIMTQEQETRVNLAIIY
jgi:hypothetical protein